MISFVRGSLVRKAPTEAVLDISGIGFRLAISLHCFENLPETGAEVTIQTYLQIREDQVLLYGFTDDEERRMFQYLIGISGVGPRMAMNILSGRKPDELRALVLNGDVATLTALPGIGRKTAERLIVELKDKLGKVPTDPTVMHGRGSQQSFVEAVSALVTLGYSRQQSEGVMTKIFQSPESGNLSIEELLRQALKRISG